MSRWQDRHIVFHLTVDLKPIGGNQIGNFSGRPMETVAILHASKPNAQDIWGVLKDQRRRSFVERLDVHDDGSIWPALTTCCVKHDVTTGGLNQLCAVKNKGKVHKVVT